MKVTRAMVAAAATASVLIATACTSDSEPTPTPTPTTSSAAPDQITFGVFGSQAELDAFQETVDTWNADPEHTDVEVTTWPSRAEMRADLESGAEVPDVFLASRTDLAWLLEQGYTQPVDELLDERGVSFGDGYSRNALQAFSTDNRLQCMPYGVSPMVIYYNKALVNFEKMRNRGLDAPADDATSWSFDQFAAAAQFASRPKRKTKGIHIAATLQGLSPFIQSGGGSVFDDAVDPKSLAFSSDGSRSALERTLELLRNPQVTLDDTQLQKSTPVEWFTRGKLGMIAGYRSLVPKLRAVPGLEFDVMPMPRLDSSATVGDVTGLCLSAATASTPVAADFMLHEISAESVGVLARTGYLDPANVEVAFSEDFLQTGSQPANAVIFNNSARSMSYSPLIDTLSALEDAIQPSLEQMVYGVGVLDLDAVTEEVDEISKSILDPEPPSDSASPSESESTASE